MNAISYAKEARVHSPVASAGRVVSGYGATRIRLDLGGLSPFEQLAWLSFACSAVVQAGCAHRGAVHAGGLHAGVAAVVERADGRWPLDGAVVGEPAPLPAADDAFTFITGARALTVKLVAAVPPIVVEPAECEPVAVDPRIYWAAPGDAGVLSRLQWLLDALGDPVANTEFARYAEAFGPASRSVSLLTSVFRGDEYLDGFLDNAADLEGYGDCEHFLIRPDSPGDEHASLLAHVRSWPSAIYINLPHDPGLYETWNLAARLSTARYLSNANLDDRRAPGHLARLCAVLDERPDIDVASSPLRVTYEPNLAWADSGACSVMFGEAAGGTFAGADLLGREASDRVSYNLPHCMPVWRRELHAQYGFFDETRFGPSADWEFWLRVGSGGARFYVAPEPLGVFLRAPASYWTRGGEGFDYDRRIARGYAFLHVSGREHPPAPRCASLHELKALHESGEYLELTGRLGTVVASACERSGTGRPPSLIDRLVKRLVGVPVSALRELANPRDSRGRAFRLRLLAFVAEGCDIACGDPSGARLSAQAHSVLSAICMEGYVMGEEMDWLLAHARVSGLSGDRAHEQLLLLEAHARDRRLFWRRVQAVYRFSVTVERIAALVEDSVRAPGDGAGGSDAAAQMEVRFFPDYTKANIYQTLLYDVLQQREGRASGIERPFDLYGLRPTEGARNIMHIHWLNHVDRGLESAVAVPRRALFLATLRRLRARGFELFWTVHNRLNHECADEEQECEFRRAVYGLADRVYVHHPLAAEELDWLPDRAKLCLLEHGPYPVQLGDRAGARAALGFSAQDRVLLHFGKIRPYKGLDGYLPALHAALEASSNLKVVILGAIEDPAVERSLEACAHSRLIVRNRFVPEDELVQHLHASDVGFLSYRRVLTSGALFHMLSYGVPVIAPDRGVIPGYVVDGWNGHLYSDEDDLHQALESIVAVSDASLATMRDNASTVARGLCWHFP